MKTVKQTIFDQFEKYQLYRRLIVLYGCFLVTYVSISSLSLIALAINNDTSLLELAAALAAAHVPPMAAFGFISKLYWEGKSNASNP